MKFLTTILACLFAVPSALAATLTTAAQVYDRTLSHPQVGGSFCLTGTVTYAISPSRDYFGLSDASGSTRLHFATDELARRAPRPGSLVTVSGTLGPTNEYVHAFCSDLTVLANGPAPAPQDIRAAEAYDGAHDFAFVRVSGVISDVFRDEIDTRYVFLVINDGSASISITYQDANTSGNIPTKLIGRQATVAGVCASVPGGSGTTRQLGQTIVIDSPDAVVPTDDSAPDLFAAPEIPDRLIWNPADANAIRSGKTTGRVLAVWQGKYFLVKTPDGRFSRVTLLEGPPPRYGDFVEAAGFQETDLFQINLTHAAWRPAEAVLDFVPEKPLHISIASLLSDENGHPQVTQRYNGRTVRTEGRIRDLPNAGHDGGRFWLDAGGWSVSVDASSIPPNLAKLKPGCTLSVTGTCITEAETWHPNAPFPRAKSNILVLRTPDDIAILSDPPWWTTGRMLIAMGVLALLLIAVSVWNVTLNRLAERRGRALADEKLAHVESELKIRERTRLAVELHDSISQVLTGVAMEVNAAKRLALDDPNLTTQHLSLASKSLTSCREELRNCMWDLRNLTLEETDINEAILRTLKPHVGKAKLTVRFNVPRERLSDNTAHTFLCVIRELAVNAVRHGHATEIRVAGAIEGDRLLFSVVDNGCGFDTAASPGPDQGHFGLQGIRERIKAFGGSFGIAANANRCGMRAAIAIRITPEIKS